MFEEIKELTDANFQKEVINENGVVMVDFYAEWCGPCKMIDKTIKELKDENEGKIKICRADVETNSSIVGDLGISGVPAIFLFKSGKLVSKNIGLRSKEDLQHDINEACNG